MPYRLEGCDGLMHLGARRYSTREVVYLCEMHGDGVGRCLAVSLVFPRGSVGGSPVGAWGCPRYLVPGRPLPLTWIWTIESSGFI